MDGPIFLIFSNPKEGHEDEYNDWYTNEHLDAVLRLGGIKAAQRFVVADSGDNSGGLVVHDEHYDRYSAEATAKNAPCRYLAVYEADPGKLDVVAESLARVSADPSFPKSGLQAPGITRMWFTPVSPRKEAP